MRVTTRKHLSFSAVWTSTEGRLDEWLQELLLVQAGQLSYRTTSYNDIQVEVKSQYFFYRYGSYSLHCGQWTLATLTAIQFDMFHHKQTNALCMKIWEKEITNLFLQIAFLKLASGPKQHVTEKGSSSTLKLSEWLPLAGSLSDTQRPLFTPDWWLNAYTESKFFSLHKWLLCGPLRTQCSWTILT